MRKWIGLSIVVLVFSMPLSLSAAEEELLEAVDDVFELIYEYYYRADELEEADLIHGALRGMVEALDDPHSEFLTAEEHEEWQEALRGEFSGVGIEIELRDESVYVVSTLPGTPAEQAGIRSGDMIVEVDEESVEGWSLRDVSAAIRGERGTEVTLTLEREDEAREKVLERDTIRIDPVDVELLAEAPVARVDVLRMDQDTSRQLGEALFDLAEEELEGIILDLRSNPGGFVQAAVESASYFIDRGQTITETRGPAYGERVLRSRGIDAPELPMVVLVDEWTASAGEILAGALQDHEAAVLIGRPTFGKGSIQEFVYELPDGSVLLLTTGEYFTPDGNPVHEEGITPDIVVEWDPDADDPGQADIDAAVEWLLEEQPAD